MLSRRVICFSRLSDCLTIGIWDPQSFRFLNMHRFSCRFSKFYRVLPRTSQGPRPRAPPGGEGYTYSHHHFRASLCSRVDNSGCGHCLACRCVMKSVKDEEVSFVMISRAAAAAGVDRYRRLCRANANVGDHTRASRWLQRLAL